MFGFGQHSVPERHLKVGLVFEISTLKTTNFQKVLALVPLEKTENFSKNYEIGILVFPGPKFNSLSIYVSFIS